MKTAGLFIFLVLATANSGGYRYGVSDQAYYLPAISQHLKVLHDAELVLIRQDGTRRYYRSRPEGLAGLREWLDSFWSTRLDELKRMVEADHAERSDRADP